MTWGPLHFTRNWRHPICNRFVDCEDKPVVSDAALLASFLPTDLCRNCDRLLTNEERAVRDSKYLVLKGGE